jgi:hypothetical protein
VLISATYKTIFLLRVKLCLSVPYSLSPI